MSLHRTDVHYRGFRVWIESEKPLDKYEEAAYVRGFSRDFAHMLKAVGVDVRAHMQSTDQEATRAMKRQTALEPKEGDRG